MIARREEILKSINARITGFCSTNKGLAQHNYTDSAISAEDFFAELFNIVYRDKNSNLVNTNKDNSNYPGIDLIDLNNKIAVQVTVENSLGKVKDTFSKIPKFEDNKEYSKVKFVIQTGYLTDGIKKIGTKYEGYDIECVCVVDILREIEHLPTLNHLEDVCKFVERAIKIPDNAVAQTCIDNEAFDILFRALKEVALTDKLDGIEDPLTTYRSSPTEKKEKFKEDWVALIDLYKISLGMTGGEGDHKKLINYEKNISDFFTEDIDELQKELIIKYLRVESFVILQKNQGQPVLAINELTEKLKSDFNVGFLSKTQVMSFILNMFFKCDVFPLGTV